MTKEEILAMEATDLAVAVAQEVMGWKFQRKAKWGWYIGKKLIASSWWAPATDISAAWQVVEKMEAEGYGHKHLKYSQNRHEGVTWVFMQPGRGIFEASGRDIKEAICKAALIARLAG